jgi:hypothetical protein
VTDQALPEFMSEYSEDQLMKQATPWAPEKWKAVFAASPKTIDRLRERCHEPDAITRRDLFNISSEIVNDRNSAIDLFVGCMIWGAPKGNRFRGGMKSVRNMLSDRRLEEKLNRALETVNDADLGPVGAFVGFSRQGENQVPYLGPSFFTKFLYFGGYYRTSHRLKPLIADDRVSITLRDQGWPLWSGTLDDVGYRLFLEIAADWTRQLGWQPENAHVVEYALFSEADAVRDRWSTDKRDLRTNLLKKYHASNAEV